jgi:hypothetical protein
MSSAILGANLALDNLVVVTVNTTPGQGSVSRRIDTLVAGDQIAGTLDPYYQFSLAPNTSGTFQETFTFQLQYIPEPSGPLALSSGIGALALIANRRIAEFNR